MQLLTRLGVSCFPLAIANKDRLSKGSEHHADAGLFYAFIQFMFDHEPQSAWLENVFGFLLRESKTNPEAPITRFLREAQRLLGDKYSIRVFLLDAGTFLCFTRKRVWIHFMHKDAGGARAHMRMAAMVKACVAYRLSLPPVETDDVLLPDEDQRIKDFVEAMSIMKPHFSDRHLSIC